MAGWRVWGGPTGVFVATLATAGCQFFLDEETCFVAGTLIATPDGARSIESLRIGDAVWSYDRQAGLVARTLHAIHRARARVVCRVELRGACIRGVTPSHPMYDAARDTYVALRDLSPEARLLLVRDGMTQALPIERLVVEEAPEPSFEVFNLTVQGPEHNYIADGVLVHNKSLPPDPLVQSTCGDGVSEDWEECDDGNLVDLDDCSNSCERYNYPGNVRPDVTVQQ
jgi:cysteine-rich repeat protein